MRNERAQPGRSISPRPENAFTFQVPLIPASFSDLRYGNRVVALPEVQEPGCAFLFDLSARPTVGLGTEFDNLRCYISQRTIDDLAYEKILRRAGGLVQPYFGERDPILFHLAKILVPALANPSAVSSAFVEYVALAFYEHVITAYGGVPSVGRRYGGLPPWQIRRIVDFMEANLANDPSISELAHECNLSSSYFTQAFKQTMSMAPHQWLMKRRVERSKTMLRDTNESLAAIALVCGYWDQSHFSRVFTRFEGCSPSEWRRLQKIR
jgi:AraC-like DNA-binding protein